MLYRPSQTNQTDNNIPNTQINAYETHQHGIHQQQQHQQCAIRHNIADEANRRSILLDVPPETLTSITSHLTPPTLLALGCVSSYLAHHVKEDNTWRRAYACHFLGISPESDIEFGNPSIFSSARGTGAPLPPGGWKTLLLRRDHGRNWRDEFSWRYVMIGRWSRSRSTPTTHTPIIHSPISNLHLTNVPSASLSQSTLGSGSTQVEIHPTPTPTPYIYPSTRYGAPALLTSSIQYGVVVRSMPLSGRVLTGYLDASAGARLGVGGGNLNIGAPLNGNPNVQFTPNVTACDVVALPSNVSSPSARVVWGTRSGELIFSTAPRAMDGTLRATGGGGVRVRRCRVGDEHESVVRDVKWVAAGDEGKGRWAVSASAGDDGRIKFWDTGSVATSNNANTDPAAEDAAVRCIWTSEPMLVDRFGSLVWGLTTGGGVVPDKCVRVEASFSAAHGGLCAVVGVGESGDARMWIGPVSAFGVGAVDNPDAKIDEVFVECPFKTVDGAAKRITALYIDPNSIGVQDGKKVKTRAAFLLSYEDDPLFYRVRVVVDDHADELDEHSQVDITSFGNPNFGPTSTVVPFFGKAVGSSVHAEDQDAEKNTEASFVLVGDHIGCVSLYAWETHSSANTSTPIFPLRTFEAHRDGASVTALWWDGLVLVTGSARGTAHVWDAITFAHLRSFVSPVGRVRGPGRARLPAGALALGPHGAGGAAVVWGVGAGGAEGMARGREAVRHIVVNTERDVLVVAVGDTVMAWHAGVVGRAAGRGGGKGGVRGRHAPGTGVHGKKRAGAGIAKYVGQYEMRQTIAESRDLLDAERRASGSSSSLSRRVVEHRAGLDSLGLSEVEAVEYVLMLSRDEAAAAERARLEDWDGDLDRAEDGVFEGDFEEYGLSEDNDNENDDASLFGASPSVSSASSSTPGSISASVSSSSSSSSSTSSTRARARVHNHARLGMAIVNPGPPRTSSGKPILGPSTSNEKVQISPPWRGEPKQAGEEYLADEVIGEISDDERVQEHYFPPIPGSTGTSPKDADKTLKGKGKEKKVGIPSASLRGKGKSESMGTKNVDVRRGSKADSQSKVQTPPSLTNTTSTPGGSPTSLKASAWSVPLKPKEAVGSTSFSGVAAAPGPASSRPSFGAGASARSRMSTPASAGVYGGDADDMDEDLRFALELSLVEARSREEDV